MRIDRIDAHRAAEERFERIILRAEQMEELARAGALRLGGGRDLHQAVFPVDRLMAQDFRPLFQNGEGIRLWRHGVHGLHDKRSLSEQKARQEGREIGHVGDDDERADIDPDEGPHPCDHGGDRFVQG